jgi:hypothetical protein
MVTTVRSLLTTVLDAHGGAERWRRFDRVTARVVSGGFLWAMKGIELDRAPRRMTSDFKRQWTRTEPFGDPDWHMTYQPERVVIRTAAGDTIAEQLAPRETFDGHAWETAWTPLQLAYFNGYAMWTYYNLPFLLGEPGVETSEISSVALDGRTLRGLRADFSASIHTHSPTQQFYFDADGLLRRHDYAVDVAGGTLAAHFVSDYVEVQGLQLPTRRRVYMRNEDGTLATDRVLVSADLSDFELTRVGRAGREHFHDDHTSTRTPSMRRSGAHVDTPSRPRVSCTSSKPAACDAGA